MATIKIRHHFDVNEVHSESGPYITFYQWLPIGEKEGLVREIEDMVASIWVDESCVYSWTPITKEEIGNRINVLIKKVMVDIVLKEVPSEHASFIYDQRDRYREIVHGIGPDNPNYESLESIFRDYAIKVQQLAIDTYNRFVYFVRNLKGQFWLEPYVYDSESIGRRNNMFRVVASIDDGEFFDWCPDFPLQFTVELGNESRYIRNEDWSQAKRFIADEFSKNLVLELISNAENLQDKGYLRSSIIEVVAALELALFNMSRKPDVKAISTHAVSPRVDLDNLKNQVKHLGFSGSMRYLVPILFVEEILPRSLLDRCNEAINLRGSVVHKGQRNVSIDILRVYIGSIREVCEVFLHYTLD